MASDRPHGIDEDRFDACCDHLIVRDPSTDEVVGTYRVLSTQAASRVGYGRHYPRGDVRGAGIALNGILLTLFRGVIVGQAAQQLVLNVARPAIGPVAHVAAVGLHRP